MKTNSAASLEKLNEAIKNCEYRNFPKGVTDNARITLNKTEKDCFEFLFERVGYDKQRVVKITRAEIAKEILRSEKTVSRCLKKMEKEYFIIVIRRNHYFEIHVRAPADVIDKMLANNRRRKICSQLEQMDKNVPRQESRSYYLNNINTNNRDSSKSEIVEPKRSEIVVTAAENKNTGAHQAESAAEQQIDKSAQIEQLEKQKQELEKMYTESVKDIIKNPSGFLEVYEKQRKISSWIASIDVNINRLKWKPKSLKSECRRPLPGPGIRIISEFHRIRLAMALADQPHSEQLGREITFSVTNPRGSLIRSKFGGKMSVEQGISIALKLIRENRWETPRGMQ